MEVRVGENLVDGGKVPHKAVPNGVVILLHKGLEQSKHLHSASNSRAGLIYEWEGGRERENRGRERRGREKEEEKEEGQRGGEGR